MQTILRTLSNFFIPILFDITFCSVFLFKFCGPQFFISFALTYGAYAYFTLDISNVPNPI